MDEQQREPGLWPSVPPVVPPVGLAFERTPEGHVVAHDGYVYLTEDDYQQHRPVGHVWPSTTADVPVPKLCWIADGSTLTDGQWRSQWRSHPGPVSNRHGFPAYLDRMEAARAVAAPWPDASAEIQDTFLECGKDFCNRCGDCLVCYGEDPCFKNGGGGHGPSTRQQEG